MSSWKVPVQSLIDHIKTAVDVDPWAKEMAEELLTKHEATKPEVEIVSEILCVYMCPTCHGQIERNDRFCRHCGQAISWKEV